LFTTFNSLKVNITLYTKVDCITKRKWWTKSKCSLTLYCPHNSFMITQRCGTISNIYYRQYNGSQYCTKFWDYHKYWSTNWWNFSFFCHNLLIIGYISDQLIYRQLVMSNENFDISYILNAHSRICHKIIQRFLANKNAKLIK
jgi:hypothetical protein